MGFPASAQSSATRWLPGRVWSLLLVVAIARPFHAGRFGAFKHVFVSPAFGDCTANMFSYWYLHRRRTPCHAAAASAASFYLVRAIALMRRLTMPFGTGLDKLTRLTAGPGLHA